MERFPSAGVRLQAVLWPQNEGSLSFNELKELLWQPGWDVGFWDV